MLLTALRMLFYASAFRPDEVEAPEKQSKESIRCLRSRATRAVEWSVLAKGRLSTTIGSSTLCNHGSGAHEVLSITCQTFLQPNDRIHSNEAAGGCTCKDDVAAV